MKGGVTAALNYDRVNRLATDLDLHSLGNRMFLEDKKKNELFPDAFDPNVDMKSLGSRLKKEDPGSADLREDPVEVFIAAGNEGTVLCCIN